MARIGKRLAKGTAGIAGIDSSPTQLSVTREITGSAVPGLVSLTGTNFKHSISDALTGSISPITPSGYTTFTAGLMNTPTDVNGNFLYGYQTSFTTELNVGDWVNAGGKLAGEYGTRVYSIISDTKLVLEGSSMSGSSSSSQLQIAAFYNFTTSGTTLTGVFSAFTTEVAVGDYISLYNGEATNSIRQVASITNNNELEVTEAFYQNSSTVPYVVVYVKQPLVIGGSAHLVGTGTLFTTELVVNDYIILNYPHSAFGQSDYMYQIESITDDTHLKIKGQWGSTELYDLITHGGAWIENNPKKLNVWGVTGTGTLFTTELEVGDKIKLDSEIKSITSIISDTELTTQTPFNNSYLQDGILTNSSNATGGSENNLTGTGTLFTTELEVGESVVVGTDTKVIDTIIDDTHLTVTNNFTVTGNDTSLQSISVAQALTGTINVVALSTTVTGTGTLFTSELKVGDTILVEGETRVVGTITSDTILDVTVAFTDGQWYTNAVYSTPSATKTTVLAVSLCNKTAVDAMVSMRFAETEIIYQHVIAANDSLTLEYKNAPQILEATENIDILSGTSDAITYYITGVEEA